MNSRFIANALSGVIILTSLWVSAAEEVCNSMYKPSLVLNPLDCEASSEIIILGETHFDPIASALKNIAASLGRQKDIYAFIEGSNYEDKDLSGTAYGLEENLVNGISKLIVGLAVLETFGRIPAKTEDEKRAVSLSTSAFAQGFFELQSLWGDLSWMPENIVGPQSGWCIKSIGSFGKGSTITDQRAIDIAKSNCAAPFETSMDENRTLGEMGIRLLEIAKAKIDQDPKYTYLAGADFENLLGPGRDLIFAKNILGKYCAASKQKKNIWIQIGQGHAEGLNCYLRSFLPANTKVILRRPEDFRETFKNWPTAFSATSEKVKQFINTKANDIEVRTSKPEDLSEFLLFSLNKVPPALKISEVKKIITDDGFSIINWRSSTGSIDSPEYLSVTFDPFKIK